MAARRPSQSPAAPSAAEARRGTAGALPDNRLREGRSSATTRLLASRGDATVIDLDEAIDRLHQLDDEHLEDFVSQLDETLAGCRGGSIDDDTQNTITVAGAARILLRQRRAATRCNRANNIVRNLLSATETIE